MTRIASAAVGSQFGPSPPRANTINTDAARPEQEDAGQAARGGANRALVVTVAIHGADRSGPSSRSFLGCRARSVVIPGINAPTLELERECPLRSVFRLLAFQAARRQE